MSLPTNGAIQLNCVDFEFQPGERVLRNLTLAFCPGEFVGIVGPNASGKTTLARLLNAGLKPTSGTVTVDNMLTGDPVTGAAIKARIALIGSDPENQLIASSVYEEIALGLRAMALAEEEVEERCESTLASFDLQRYRDFHPFLLSVGEQFRLLLAVTLVRNLGYFVLDEVFAMLDGFERHLLRERLLRLCRQQALGVIVLSHRLDDLLCADRIIVLKNGQVVADGCVADILSQVVDAPDWHVQAPYSYQVYRSLSAGQAGLVPELGQSLPESLL